jgi:hypothetical protein
MADGAVGTQTRESGLTLVIPVLGADPLNPGDFFLLIVRGTGGYIYR